MILTEQELVIEKAAIAFAKKHKSEITKRFTDRAVYLPEANPVSVFMAGSPGAGKTEASLELLNDLASEVKVLRIDPDELRSEFPDYSGANSYLFQKAVSILVDRIHDLALDQKQSFLLDGTLSNYDRAVKNIERSLKRNRLVQILYVYQDPFFAWDFVIAREAIEGRRILPEHFIEHYFSARVTANRLKQYFGRDIRMDLLLNDINSGNRSYIADIDQIDNHVPEKYTATALMHALKN
uniref:zeta toxin family protein n=1 Tax=Cellvibrio fontiphilus TaxID=1815559 RepID=UPI002B4BB502|nr:zeta toxin family protein [Cellvibrio fontiphilus]